MAFAHRSVMSTGDKGVGQASSHPPQQQPGAPEPATSITHTSSIKVATGALVCHTWPGCGTRAGSPSSASVNSSLGMQTATFLDSFDSCRLGCETVADFLAHALSKALAS